jgi:hypothetical protein
MKQKCETFGRGKTQQYFKCPRLQKRPTTRATTTTTTEPPPTTPNWSVGAPGHESHDSTDYGQTKGGTTNWTLLVILLVIIGVFIMMTVIAIIYAIATKNKPKTQTTKPNIKPNDSHIHPSGSEERIIVATNTSETNKTHLKATTRVDPKISELNVHQKDDEINVDKKSDTKSDTMSEKTESPPDLKTPSTRPEATEPEAAEADEIMERVRSKDDVDD